MQLMQRLGSDPNEKYVDDYIEQIVRYPGSCDNVWLPTAYGYPSLEAHRKLAEFWSKAAEKFRKNGISVSLQLSNSIGHGKYMSARDCSGLVYEGSPVEKMVGHDCVTADYSFCWRGKHFKKYLLEMLSYYAEIKPDCVWVDDDFRPNNHAPVSFGCFCSNCMDEFNRRFDSAFTREELVEEILHGDIMWREKYISFIREGMSSLMYEIGETIHRISPDTSLGYQHCANGAYTGYSYDFIFDAMKRSTGKAPSARPGGGAYNDHDPNEFIKKAVLLNWQNAMLPDYVKCKCPEIENLPFTVFGKTPAGTAFETSYYFANGNTDMSYSMIMNTNEPMEWHGREFKLFSEQRKYWDRMSDCNKKTYQSGIQYFMSTEIWKKKLLPDETIRDLNAEHYAEALPLLRDAIPVAYDRNDTSIVFLHPETAKVLSDAEIEFLMGKSVITDGESIDILTKRGYDFGLKTTELLPDDILKLFEKFTDHPINPKYIGTFASSFFTPGRSAAYTMEITNGTAEVLGTYNAKAPVNAYTADKSMPYGIAEAIITTPKGAKWAVLGYCPWKGIIPTYRRDHLLDIADYISGNALCARLLSPVQAVLLPRKDKDGRTACVSVANCTIGESGEMRLLIRNPAGKTFTFMSQYDGEKTLDFEKSSDGYLVTLPSLHPWSVVTVFMD